MAKRYDIRLNVLKLLWRNATKRHPRRKTIWVALLQNRLPNTS